MKIAMQGKVSGLSIEGEPMEQVDEAPDGTCVFMVPIGKVEAARSFGLVVAPEANPEPDPEPKPAPAPAPSAAGGAKDGASATEQVTVTVTPAPAPAKPQAQPSTPRRPQG